LIIFKSTIINLTNQLTELKRKNMETQIFTL
jgi:hypothetical protein